MMQESVGCCFLLFVVDIIVVVVTFQLMFFCVCIIRVSDVRAFSKNIEISPYDNYNMIYITSTIKQRKDSHYW